MVSSGSSSAHCAAVIRRSISFWRSCNRMLWRWGWVARDVICRPLTSIKAAGLHGFLPYRSRYGGQRMGTAEPQIATQTQVADGFQLVIEALKVNGLDTIYGLPGIPITDLTRRAQAAGLRVLSFRHEQNAGYAASIAGFLTQQPGICLTVSAPGFLNGLNALAHATVNCFPMILISGSSEREIVDLQQGDYEEMDQLAIAKPVAKAAFRVLHAEDIGIGIARAIRAAVSGRPGGVYLDLPAKLFAQSIDAELGKKTLIKVVDAAPKQIPAPDAVKRALDLLRSAKKPLIILGKGAAYAQVDSEIRSLIEKTGIPYLPMSMAKGLLPDTHELCASAAREESLADELPRRAERRARHRQGESRRDARQRGRQRARLHAQHRRHVQAAQAHRRGHLGHHGCRHGLLRRRRGRDQAAGDRDRGRQRLRLLRHGGRDPLQVRLAGVHRDHEQQRRLQGHRRRSDRQGPRADRG